MGGQGHSDNSEGKEVSDCVEKCASDGSEGSEVKETSDKTREKVTEMARMPQQQFPYENRMDVFRF